MIRGMHGVPCRWSSVHSHVLMMCCIRLLSRCFPADRCAALSHLHHDASSAVAPVSGAMRAMSYSSNALGRFWALICCERRAWCRTPSPGSCRTA